MKKVLSFLFATMLAGQAWADIHFDFSAVSSSGQTLYYKIINDTVLPYTAMVTYPQFSSSNDNLHFNVYYGYNKPTGELEIPETVENNGKAYMVTSIGDYAFYGCTELMSVNIPNSITYIDYSAFGYCSKLASITIPNTITGFADWAFMGCVSLKSLNIPNSVTYIGNHTFDGCVGLASVNIPNSVKFIGEDAFINCGNLESLTYNTNAVEHQFYSHPSLKTVIVGDSVTIIKNSAFAECHEMALVVIPKSVIEVGFFAFAECFNATIYCEVESKPAGWETTWHADVLRGIRWGVKPKFTNDFVYNVINDTKEPYQIEIYQYRGDSLSANIPLSVVLDSKEYDVVSIAQYAFRGYDNLDYTAFGNAYYIGNKENPYLILVSAKNKKIESCEINSKCRFIYDEAFNGCAKLTEISIPESVIGIGYNAFSGAGLQKSEFASIGQICGIRFANNYSNPLTLTYHLYIDSTEVTNLVIPDSVESVGDYAFYGCNRLTTISIPSSVKSIGEDAFFSCNNLQKSEFASIESLCSINFGNEFANPLSIARQLYVSDEKVINLVVPETVSSIGDYAFYNCTSLASVAISDSVKSIGKRAFYGCNRLASVEIPNSVTSIGAEAFSGCSYLKSLTYNSNVIGANFNNISALQSIFIGDSIKAISGSEFNGCDNLVNVISMAAVPPTLNGDPYTYADTIFVPAASVEAYKAAPVWKRKEILPLDYYSIQAKADTARGTVSGSGNFAAKQAVTIYATPAENYHFKAWSDGNTENPRTMLVNADLDVTAIFEGDSRTVNVSANSSAFGAVVGAESYHYGDTVTFTATPVVGYHFAGWSDSVTTNPRVWIVTEDSSFNAVFEINKYAIAASADANGTVVGDSTYNHGTTATLTATANVGYHFVMWSDSVTANPRNVVATGDSVFTTVFAIDTHTITITAENGSVTGADTYDYGTEVTITATPAEGYHFVKWSDGNTNATRTIVVTGDSLLNAVFEINTYAITAATAANGTVTGGNTYNHGTTVSLKAIANDGYHFVMWNDSVTTNPRNVVATGDSVFTAVFAIDTHTVTIIGENGSVTGADTYDYGTEATISATPTEGYHFVKWSDGNTDATRKITVTEDLQLTAIFEKNEEQGGNENQGGNNEGNENQGGENNTPGTAVAESAANAINIYAHGNTIIIENATAEIRVYDTMGRLVCRDARPCISTEIRVSTAGLYIVKVGNVAKRVMVN